MNILIRPNTITIGIILNDKLNNGRAVLETNNVNIYSISLPDILKKMLEY